MKSARKIVHPRPFLITAEVLLVLALLGYRESYWGAALLLMASTTLYYTGMAGLAREELGKWAVRRFTMAYILRGLSWALMLSSAYYTYSAVIENVLPFGPKEFVVTSVTALIGAAINYVAVGIRNSVLWKVEGLKASLWFSRLNSIVLFTVAAIPFVPALANAGELKWLVELLAAPVLGSFTVFAVLGKVSYWVFLWRLGRANRNEGGSSK